MKSLSLEEVVERFLEERRGDAPPTPEAFAARFPAWREELLDLLPLAEGLAETGARTLPARTLWADVPLPCPLGDDLLLMRRLGEGGQGIVFEAEQRSLGRHVAVKVLAATLSIDAEGRERFSREAATIARLHHPNIVQVFCAGTEGGNHWYAMELVEGQSLAGNPALPPREAAALALQAARALAYAHGCDVTHCDVKPANLLLDATGVLRVGDFGLACAPGGPSPGGTPRYMSPERLAGAPPSAADDLYGLGLTLWELLAGHSPFRGLSPGDVTQRLRAGDLPPPPHAPADLRAIVAKCLRADPRQRYGDMEALADDLRRFLNREPVRARPASPLRTLLLWARRRPALAALGAVAATCAAAFVVTLWVGLRQTSAALGLAEDTLTRVFAHAAAQAPSRQGTALLTDLLPYWRTVAERRGLPADRLAEANRIIGDAALRLGDDTLAEEAYRRLDALAPSPASGNRLAEALRRNGREDEAQTLWRRVAESGAPLEAAHAWVALGDALRAFGRVTEALAADAHDPRARLAYATLLGEDPRRFGNVRVPGVEPNAVAILQALSEAEPDNSEVGLALLTLAERRLRRGALPEAETQRTLDLADSLLAHRPNDPALVTAAVRLWEAHAERLRRAGDTVRARQANERVRGALTLLVRGPEAPNAAKESLLGLLIGRVELARRRGEAEAAAETVREAERQLERYDGPQAEALRKRLAEALGAPQPSEKENTP